MNDPKFVKTELKLTASEELEEELKAELEEELEEKSILLQILRRKQICQNAHLVYIPDI